MQILEEAAKALNMAPEELERKSIKTFMEKELTQIEAEIFLIGAKHGVKSVLELDARLQRGEMTEEELLDDFMEFDFLESRRNELIKVLGKLI
jgi:hypothetical protein